jgi:hypothetical protein
VKHGPSKEAAQLVADHNSTRWLRVEYRAKRWGKIGWGFEPGWFVVRTCPCHPNKPVTLALPDEATARRAMALLALHQQVQVAPHADGRAEIRARLLGEAEARRLTPPTNRLFIGSVTK